MSVSQIFLGIIILLVLLQTLKSFKRETFSIFFKIIWLSFWLAALFIVLWPNFLTWLANLIGIGRGADLLIYSALILMFFSIYKLFVFQLHLNEKITIIIRELAINGARRKKGVKKEH